MSLDTVRRYFDAFNAGDIDGMMACVAPEVAHYVNEGEVRLGADAFKAFCDHMAQCYDEHLTELILFQATEEAPVGTRIAAEYMVNGTYLETDPGLPEATGQSYRLPAGSFMTLESGLITRITTYYNLADWIRQVS